MNVHFIAIGGSAMHNLAIALHEKGEVVTGSDDEIFEPSKSRLNDHELLPKEMGWNVENIHANLDAIVLGMHAREDNPELLKAKELGITIYSYPEFLYEQAKDKKRVVIGGSHGKTSITAMILHVLHHHNIDCDYMVGAQLQGFDTMVRLTDAAPIAIFEGDEYLSSPIDRRPKFHLYQADIALISGIAWDHINVFPTFENYLDQFRIFAQQIPEGGALIYCDLDENVLDICQHSDVQAALYAYGLPAHEIVDGQTFLKVEKGEAIPLDVFGDHNLANMEGARMVCQLLGIESKQFREAITSFKGASNRMELVHRSENLVMYKDFAHSPSKVTATTKAVRQQYPEHNFIACLELHTFSSLNEEFLLEYKGAMEAADVAMVYYNPHTIEHKKLKAITEQQVKEAFGRENLSTLTESDKVVLFLKEQELDNAVILMMSSGNFDGIEHISLFNDLDA
ncbi:MAG TPA: peptidoglycan synthetase [Flavobacteriales bacterium]|nr:peptidoglycan synthetase [Flavobacteriales bacterium]